MPMTPAELEAYRRSFEAARSFEDDEEWFKELSCSTTNNNTPIVASKKPVLKPTAQQWSFQGTQPPTGPRSQKAAMESAAPKKRVVQHPVQYPRSGLGNSLIGSGAAEHERVDSRASSSEMDGSSRDGSVGAKGR